MYNIKYIDWETKRSNESFPRSFGTSAYDLKLSNTGFSAATSKFTRVTGAPSRASAEQIVSGLRTDNLYFSFVFYILFSCFILQSIKLQFIMGFLCRKAFPQ